MSVVSDDGRHNDTDIFGHSILREIHYRVLTSNQGEAIHVKLFDFDCPFCPAFLLHPLSRH